MRLPCQGLYRWKAVGAIRQGRRRFDNNPWSGGDAKCKLSGILFVVDRGFYSARNLSILSANDNSYILPVPSNTDIFRDAVNRVSYTGEFYYRSGKKHARKEYTSRRTSDTEYVYEFRDIDENEECRFNYQHCIGLGKSGYTQEKFEQNKEVFGVYVLQSNAAMTAEKMVSAVRSLDDNTISVQDILLMARCMKMEWRGSNWNLKNARKWDLEILKRLGFEPKMMFPDS